MEKALTRNIMQAGCRDPERKVAPVPCDPAVPGSALLREPGRLVEVLIPLLFDSPENGARVLASRMDIHRYVPGKRYIVEVEFRIGRGKGNDARSRRVVAKLYAGDHGAEAFETLQGLRSHGFAGTPWTLPEPLGYVPEWKVLVLNWAKGQTLRRLLLTQTEAPGAFESGARWLLKLHACGFSGGRRYTFSRHLHTLARWNRSLAQVDPGSAGLFGDVLARVERRGLALAGWTPVPTHRDFSPDHIVIDGDQITVLDLDEFCQYDPLFDVAHFVTHLRFLGLVSYGNLSRFDHLAARFLRSYQEGALDYCAERVRLYQAVAYLKLVHIVAIVQRLEARQTVVASLLREAQLLV